MSDSPWAHSSTSDEGALRFSATGVKVWRVRRRLSRAAANVGLGLILLPVILSIVSLLGKALFDTEVSDDLAVLWAATWVFGAPLAGVVAFVTSLRRKLRVHTAEVRGEELRLQGDRRELTLPRREIAGALVIARNDGGHEVEVVLSSGNVLYVDAGGKEGALADSLGPTHGERRTVVPLGGTRSPLWSGLRAVFLGTVAATFSSCPGVALSAVLTPRSEVAIFLTMALTFLLTALLTAHPWSPRRLVIGADGVLLEGALRKRFFPRARIFGVGVVERRVSLLLADGEGVRPLAITTEEPGRQHALIRRIQAALDAHGGGDPRAELLARGRDSIARWRERVGKLVAKGEGYRRHALPSDVLVRIAADGAAPADVRLGAAMAIGSGDDPDAKAQLRIAAEEIADDDLRAALAAATDGSAEDEALEAACTRAGMWSTERR